MKALTILFIVVASCIVFSHGRLQPLRRVPPDMIEANETSLSSSETLSQNRPSFKELENEQRESASTTLYRPFKNMKSFMIESNRIHEDENKPYKLAAATCPDRDIARYLNYALTTYIHDMDGLSRYVLNQIIASRKPGKWVVHAQVISNTRQGRDWQTSTNAEIFSQKDQYACFYHDNLTYILVLRVY